MRRDLNPPFFLAGLPTANTHKFALHLRPIARAFLAAALFLSIAPRVLAAPLRASTCARIDLTGLVNAGEEWKTALGEGWVFRVLPIVPGPEGYTGWDLVVDRDPPAGYPDALLLATPPYNALNDREIGTTYGLRAQDAIGWNPRSFHFLTNPAAFKEGQKLFLDLAQRLHVQPAAPAHDGAGLAVYQLARQLAELRAGAAAGVLRILDAGLAPGNGDPTPFAQNWAAQGSSMSYILEPQSGAIPSPRGELDWIRFSITLWLPLGWKLPPGVSALPATCPP